MAHEERNTGKPSGSTTIGRQEMRQSVRRQEEITPLCIDGKKMKYFGAARGWTEENCLYLDHLAPTDMSYVTTWKERSRYELMLVSKLNDGKHPGKCQTERIFHKQLAHLERQQRRVNPQIPKNERERQRPFDEQLRSELEWQSWNWKVGRSQASSSSSTDWWQSGKWHEPQQEEWQNQQWWEE